MTLFLNVRYFPSGLDDFLNSCFSFPRRNFYAQQSKTNVMKVSPRSPPQSATADYLRGSELQAVHPRYHLLFIHLTILAWGFIAA